MTTLRMPQPGEKWRLRMRHGEGDGKSCPYCGYVFGTHCPIPDGTVLKILEPSKNVYCGVCENVSEHFEGYVAVSAWINGLHVRIPYTWLEPLDWRPS